MSQNESGPWPSRRGFLAGAALGAVAGGVGVWLARRGANPKPEGEAVNPRLFTFIGGAAGPWSVVEANAIIGEPLPAAARLDIVNAAAPAPAAAAWVLRGVTSNERYATRPEKELLVAKQVVIGRPEADRLALIPIRKSAKWWALTQDERRAIFEERSNHVKIGLKTLPAVARRLHHCRDLGEGEPFDFLTLFDYAAKDAAAFDDMVAELRASEEWTFVDREIDIRLVRDGA